MTSFWEMNLMQGKNPAHTASFLNGYDNRGFTPSQVLAREGAQNSSDAGRNCSGLTELRFHFLRASGESKERIASLLELQVPLAERLEAYKETARYPSFCAATKSLFEADDIEFLLIRDFNTCGLGGRWDEFEKSDHFGRLVCALNLDDKSDNDPNSGGSFGLGKTTYANSSHIHTVLYHSVFEKSAATNGVSRRLMVAGVYPRHSIKETKYGGFAYWGEKAGSDPGVAKPFDNEAAADLWQSIMRECGQEDLHRDDEDYGTDILIFQPAVNLDELQHAIEEYYWPAIIQRQLSVTLYDEDSEAHYPAPLGRSDLRPFIELFQKVNSGKIETSETRLISKLRKRNQLETGMIGLEAVEDADESDTKINTVALMRGTGMVINYMPVGDPRYEPVRGVYVADKDVYKILIASENAAHSEWDPQSRRLAQTFSTEGAEVVKAVLGSIKNQFQKFQKSLQPAVPKRSNEHGFFARLMSKALSGRTGEHPPEPGPPEPASVSLQRKVREDTRSIWRLRITDNEHTPDAPFKMTLRPTVSIAGDSKRVALKRREITLKTSDGQIIDKGHRPEIEIDFQKGAVFESILELDAPGEYNYVVTCRCSAVIDVDEDSTDEPEENEAPRNSVEASA